MANGQLTALLRHIRQLMVPQQMRMQSDSQLLQAFCASQDEHAFAALVQSHGPMVWRVCHAVLRQTEEAEDAFQATFLVLARKATSIRKTESLPSWLHGVAYRIAVSAQRSSIRRTVREATLQPQPTLDPASEASWREVQAILHAEVERLPEKYRAPFALCFLEGHSRAETARRLGLKQGAVWSRLAKARQRLQARLTRRGISLSAVLTAAAIADGEAPAAVVSRLAQSVIQAALQYAAGKSLAGGLLSTKVLSLANGRMASMFLTKVKITLAVVVASAGIMSAGLFGHRGFAWSSSEEEPAQEQKPAVQQASQPKIAEQKVAAGQNPNGERLPAGAQVRLGLDHFRRDGGTVSFLAFSKNGSSLYAAGTMDGTIHSWDAATGKELGKFSVFENRPIGGASMAISPDGTLVASADRNYITIWNLPLARRLRQIKLSTARPSQQVVFTPDGKSLATLGSEDGNNEVNFWDIGTGKLLRSVRLQMPPTGAPRPDVRPQIPGFGGRQLPAQPILPRLMHLDFSPDGRVIICQSGNRQAASFWDLKGTPLKNFPTDARNYSFSPDGQTLAVGTASGVWLWDLPSGNQRIELPGLRSPAAVAFSPDGKTVAASSITLVALWDAATAVQIGTISDVSRNSATTIRLLRFSPDSKTLAGAGEESVIRVWDVATGKERDAGIGHRDAITGLAYAPDGSSLATVAARDRYVRLWNAVSGNSLQAFMGGAQARTPLFSQDGRTVLAGGTYLFMWDAASGKALQRLGFPKHPLARPGVLPSVESIAISADGTTVWGLTTQRPVAQRAAGAAADEGSIRVASWDMATGKETSLREDPSEANSLWQLSPDGRLRVSTRNGLIKVHEVATGKLMGTLDGQCTSVSVVAFSFDSKKIAGLCFQDDERPLSASVWELPAGTETHRILTQMKLGRSGGSGYHPAALTFSRDGKILATGAQENGGIQLWDLDTNKEIGRFQGYDGTVTSLAFDPNGRRLASGLANGTALIWDVASAAKQLPLVKISKGIDRAPVLVRKPLTDSPKPLEGATNLIRQLLQEAQRATSKVEDSSARAHGLEQCAILQSRLGNLALQRSLFEEARNLIAEMPQEKKMEARRELARCCGQAGDLEEIKKVLGSIPFAQRPDWASNQEDMVYYLASTALAQAGKMTDALELARANKYADKPQSRRDLILADSATYFALTGDSNKALATIDSISVPLFKVVRLAGNVRGDYWNDDLPSFPHGIAMKLDEAGNRPAAMEFLNRAEEIAGTLKEPDQHARSWAIIACCRARMGDLKGCQSLQQRIPPDSNFQPYPSIAIARAYAAAGQGESARALIGQLKGSALQAQGFAQLAAGQLATGDGRAALDSADKAWELVQTYSFAFGAANSLMDIRIQANDFRGAAALFTSLGREEKAFVYEKTVAHQARTGDFEGAQDH